eukprot:1440071-Pleurochrysis_carterae.AAC.1
MNSRSWHGLTRRTWTSASQLCGGRGYRSLAPASSMSTKFANQESVLHHHIEYTLKPSGSCRS